MAAEVFFTLGKITFSGLKQPTDQGEIVINSLRVSVWGTMGSGGTALVSFIFSRYLIKNEPWKSIAPHVVKATLWCYGTFAIVAAYLFYHIMDDESPTKEPDPYTQVNIHNLKALLLTCLAIVYNPSKSFANQAPHLIFAL
jgi:hypothetical protein